MDERDLFGQKFINAELDDGVRLAAANLHQVPGPCRDTVHLARNLLREVAVTIFVEVFHVPPARNSPSSSICFKYSNTFCASSSSSRLRAKPACTMT